MEGSVRWLFDDHKHYNGKDWLVIFPNYFLFTPRNICKLYLSAFMQLILTLCLCSWPWYVSTDHICHFWVWTMKFSRWYPVHSLSLSPAGWSRFTKIDDKTTNSKNLGQLNLCTNTMQFHLYWNLKKQINKQTKKKKQTHK